MGLTAYWTQFAQDRLKEIFDYYELKVDLSTAQNITNDIVDSTISLEDTPQKGQKEDLLKNRAQEFRYIICNNYKIIYWIDEFNRRIEIAHVFHCRRNPVVMLDFVS